MIKHLEVVDELNTVAMLVHDPLARRRLLEAQQAAGPGAEPGRVQDLDIPDALKALYKTVWEIKQRKLVDMAADRGAFIDQSQSFNVHMSDPNFGKLTSLHFHAWKVDILSRPRLARPPETAHPISTTGLASE